MQASATLAAPSRTHAVSFYDDDREGAEAITAYVQDGWSHGETVVVVATASHRETMHALLRAQGADPGRDDAPTRLIDRDATELLTSLCHDGSLDHGLFATQVGGLLTEAAGDGHPVRVYGEMVAELWGSGRVAQALELEALWNDLATREEFSLLCGYSTDALRNAGLVEVSQVCDLHAEVVPPTRYDSDTPSASSADPNVRSVVFFPVPQAVAAVRRFVRAVFQDWGAQCALSDATLAISEMATNAVLHAHSPFRVLVERCPAGVLIAVEDAGAGCASQRVAQTTEPGGRGLAIVQAVADRWGTDPLDQGKVVWAEFHLTPQSPVLAAAPDIPDLPD